jgi:predicted transcriptional regulator
VLVETYPGIQSGAITEKLDINVSSVKRALTDLVDKKLFEKDGVGRGQVIIYYDLQLTLSSFRFFTAQY